MEAKTNFIGVLLAIFTLAIPHFNINAQSASEKLEDEIAVLFDSLRSSSSDSMSHAIGKEISKKMGTLLETSDSSFYAPLNKLKFMGKCYSDNGDIRVYTWNYPLSDKTYGYGGYVQFKPTKKRIKQQVKPIALNTYGNAYLPKAGPRVSSNNWYGALYYSIISTKKDGDNYYIFLGWGGNDALSDFKVAETVKISNNDKKITFGGVSAFNSNGKSTNRLVLQFSNDARVSLDYDNANKRIIMDHLSPSDPFYNGIYSYYGPDFTYDAYLFDKKSKGVWRLQENIDAKNQD